MKTFNRVQIGLNKIEWPKRQGTAALQDAGAKGVIGREQEMAR